MHVPIRVRPGASRTHVGGVHDGRLVVSVSSRPVGGAATEAALRAVADAFGVRRRRVALVQGRTARDKVVAITGVDASEEARLAARLDELRG